MTRVGRRYIRLPWGEVHARHAERGQPEAGGDVALVLLHQTPLSSWVYEAALRRLPRWLRTVALDTPGYGSSTPPPEPLDIPGYAECLWETLDALGIERPVLLGHHTGAVIAVQAALGRPDLARGLILHGYPAFTPEERSERSRDPRRRPIVPDLQGAYLGRIHERVRSMYPEIDAATAARCVQDYLACGPDFAVAYRAVYAYDLLGALPRLTTPTWVCCGDQDLTYFTQDRVRRALPAAPWHRFPVSGDFVAHERPEAFAVTVATFLEGLR